MQTRKMYLGLDVGTSGLKTILIDHNGRVKASDTRSYPLDSLHPLWSEQDPQDWWRAAVKSLRHIIKATGIDPKSIAGVGLSGQMHGSIFMGDGASLKPLRPAILWNDQRTAEQCQTIEKIAGGRKKLIRMVANPALTGYTAPKILWVREHEPEIFDRVRHVLLPKDYLRLCLTGVYATEVSDASGTLLFDVRKRRWHLELIKKLGFDPDWFPACSESTEVTGFINQSASRLTGLAVGTPVVGGGGDQACGAVGNGIVDIGIVSATIGTSGVVFAHSQSPQYDPDGRLQTMCHAVPGQWCVFGCMLAAGGAFQWYKNTLGGCEVQRAETTGRDAYELLVEQARKSSPGCNGLFFLPYLTGERCPYSDPSARACFIGLTAGTSRSEMTRSVLEGITYGMKDQLAILRQMGIEPSEVRASGGGAASRFWRQLQADMYATPVVRVNVNEGSAFGAAILAAVGTGRFESVPRACEKIIKTTDRVDPRIDQVRLYDRYHQQYQTLYRTLKPQFSAIAELSAKQE